MIAYKEVKIKIETGLHVTKNNTQSGMKIEN